MRNFLHWLWFVTTEAIPAWAQYFWWELEDWVATWG